MYQYTPQVAALANRFNPQYAPEQRQGQPTTSGQIQPSGLQPQPPPAGLRPQIAALAQQYNPQFNPQSVGQQQFDLGAWQQQMAAQQAQQAQMAQQGQPGNVMFNLGVPYGGFPGAQQPGQPMPPVAADNGGGGNNMPPKYMLPPGTPGGYGGPPLPTSFHNAADPFNFFGGGNGPASAGNVIPNSPHTGNFTTGSMGVPGSGMSAGARGLARYYMR